MKDDTIDTGVDSGEATESGTNVTYTQVASCACGDNRVERRRQSLRAKLERETYERKKRLEQSFMSTFRNLFNTTKN